MRTFSVLNGLPIISLKAGEEIGKVIDLLFYETNVKGLLIDKNGWLNRHLFLALKNIHAVGQDAILIEDVQKVLPFDKKQFPFYFLHSSPKKIVGKTLMSSEGEKLGLVEDVYFDEFLGNIVGYEVTDGLIADIKEGRRVVKTSTPLTVGEEVLVIELNC